MPVKAFISYSHIDEKWLDRLHKHLAMLKRDQLIETWTDHKILPGSKVGETIDSNLISSSVFLALLSPDYLASNYCYEKEFQAAQGLAANGKMKIIPVIVEPCDWLNSPLREYLALPKDGRPVSEWTNPNNAFVDIVGGLRAFLSSNQVASSTASKQKMGEARKPLIKRDFDSIQKSDFADRSFDVFEAYFKNACSELDGSDEIKTKFEKMSATSFTCTVVNRAKVRGNESHITIHNNKSRQNSFGDISFSYDRYAQSNTSNGNINVEADEYNLYLSYTGGYSFSRNDQKLTPEQVSEMLWNDFVNRAGIEYA